MAEGILCRRGGGGKVSYYQTAFTTQANTATWPDSTNIAVTIKGLPTSAKNAVIYELPSGTNTSVSIENGKKGMCVFLPEIEVKLSSYRNADEFMKVSLYTPIESLENGELTYRLTDSTFNWTTEYALIVW